MTRSNRNVCAIDDADFLPQKELASLQAERWREQSAYVAETSAFYADLFGQERIEPRLDALGELAFTTKSQLREDQSNHPPFGSYLAASPDVVSRVHRTSGTTGQAMNLALSAGDAQMTADVFGRAQRAAGLGPGHRVVHCLNYQLWMGGLTDHLGLEASGATVIPFGVGSSERLIQTIRELGITAISCTPSYPAVLERTVATAFQDIAPRDLGLKLGLFGGEAGLDDPAFRRHLEDVWGFAVRNSNYGVSDVLSNVASQCTKDNDLHFVAGDVLYPELVDPDGDRILPWREGESGELILTHLAKDCQPLVRFRTGDIVTLTGTGACVCGRHATRFRVIGRTDDMVVVRGINAFPTMVASVINQFAEFSTEYRIVLTGIGPYDVLPIEVELAPGTAAEPALAERLETAIKREIGISARVRLLPPDTLERTAGKTRRVFRS